MRSSTTEKNRTMKELHELLSQADGKPAVEMQHRQLAHRLGLTQVNHEQVSLSLVPPME